MQTVQDRAQHDIPLLVLGGATAVVAIVVAVAEAVHALPSGLAVIVVIAAASITIRVLFRLRARRSADPSAAVVANIISLVLLGLSGLFAIVDLETALQSHDFAYLGDFWLDLGQHLWSLVVVLAIAVPARTMGWRSILGILLVGLLGVSTLSLLVGSPVVSALGAYDDRAVALWVPFTEELCKALPVALFALLAARNRRLRPSALDFGLLGFASGTGFALIENVDFGRADGSMTAALPFSVLFPSIFTQSVGDQTQLVAGHAVWTGLIGLAIGFGVLYSRRFRFAWVAIPIAFLISFAEHGLVNAARPPVLAVELTADGGLSPTLLVAGLLVLAWFEHRPLTSARDLRAGVLLERAPLAAHRAALATLQRPRAAAVPVPAAASTTPMTPPSTISTGENR